MKIKYLSILLVLLLLLTACTPSFETQLDKGKDLVLEGKLDEAKQVFMELVEEHGNEAQSYLNLADIYLKEKDMIKAINILNKGLEETEDKDNMNLKLGEIYLSMSDLDNAEKHLMDVKEESNELAINLLKLAGDSKDLDLLDNTFDEYKEKDIIRESNAFFENAILAYSKFNREEKIEESINKVVDLNLKLDPGVIVNAYNTLLDLDMKDLADSIIEKDIYNKEIGDLSIIPKIIKEEDNKEFINLTSGYFVTPDRLDIALLYGINYEGYYPELEIVLVNGVNGEIISTLKEETINAYMKLDTFDISGDNEDVVSLWGHAGGSGTPAGVELYKFKGRNLEPMDFTLETDMEIIFKDNFEYEIKSEKLDISYNLQLDFKEIPYYISEGIYNREGKFLVGQDNFGTGYEPMSTVANLGSGDDLLFSLELWDTYDNKSYLGIINSSFKIQGDKLVLVDLSVEDGQGNPMAFNYKEVEGYEEGDFSKLIPKKEDFKDVLSFHLSLFKETENTIKSKFGKPDKEDYYGVKYLQYDKFMAFVSAMNPNEPVYSVWTKDLLGMENNKEFIIRKFGPPEDSGYDEEELENYMAYSIENYYITFINIGEEYPYIKIKAK